MENEYALNKYFNILLKTYNSDASIKVDSESDYFRAGKAIEKELKTRVSEKYLVKFSCGNGNKADIPWICIMNKNITKSVQRGIYVAILIRKNMDGFYMGISQGITEFRNKFGKELCYKKATEASNYLEAI